MIKVLIVEDEILVRVGIKSCIPWEQHGFEIIGQAEDGLEALSLMRKQRPDIVLTDIMMPNMDGLEFIENVVQEFKGVKIIVLSCHNEMDYVKRALKMGAEDYILKLSMKPEMLLEVLQKTCELILAENVENNKINNLETGLRVNRQAIKENLFKNFMDGILNFHQFREEAAIISMDLSFSKFLVMCGKFDRSQYRAEKVTIKNDQLLKLSFLNILEEKFSELAKTEAVEMGQGEYLILLGSSSNADFSKKNIMTFIEKLNRSFEQYLNISVSFGVAEPSNKPEEIKVCYEQTKKALDYKFYRGKKSVIFSREVTDFNENSIFLDSESEKKLTSFQANRDCDKVKEIIDQLICKAGKDESNSPVHLKTALIYIVYNLIKLTERESKRFEENPSKFIMEAETLDEIRDWFSEFIDKLEEFRSADGNERKRSEVLAVQRYIYENISEDLSLENAAKMVNISRSHFSNIFKRETGENFTDYINRVKMEKARELISEENIKIYEVSQRVGINDESYFNKLFKKYIGLTPGKVRQTKVP